ncbi:MAG: class I SAM-dependent methyltransferase [Gammaproteobacteria bacterium]|nr:class I SAM-dependent methyltransferase [Gammaproteobacteria bacterium]
MDRSQLKQEWLRTALGEALLQQEARVVEEALDGVFGEQCLQLGIWGEKRTFLRFTRTQRCSVIAERLQDEPSAIGEMHRLPIETDSIDAVLLPHTLDYSDRPHEVLREVDRVLRRDGRVIVLGFKPVGLWGLRRLIPGASMPPGADHLISDRRLKDWLKLLDMRILNTSRYFFRWPLPGNKARSPNKWERRGQAWWPELAACYMLSAQKRVSTLTPVRPIWRRKPKVVAGLAEPSTRASRIRFDR